jgi:hypothetical protein
VIFTTVVAGKPASESAIACFTASEVSMMFSPVRLTIPSVTTEFPSRRAKLSCSLNPNSTSAMSRT